MLVWVPQRQRGSGAKGDWRVAPETGGGGGWRGRGLSGRGRYGGPREWSEPGGAHRAPRLGRPGRSPGSPGAAMRPCRGTSAQGCPRQGRRNASAALQTPELELPGSMVTRCPWRPEVPLPAPRCGTRTWGIPSAPPHSRPSRGSAGPQRSRCRRCGDALATEHLVQITFSNKQLNVDLSTKSQQS